MPVNPLIPNPVFRILALLIGLLTIWMASDLGFFPQAYISYACGFALLSVALFELWRFRLSRPPEQ